MGKNSRLEAFRRHHSNVGIQSKSTLVRIKALSTYIDVLPLTEHFQGICRSCCRKWIDNEREKLIVQEVSEDSNVLDNASVAGGICVTADELHVPVSRSVLTPVRNP